MEKLIVLGTGSAGTTENYNTCFLLYDCDSNYFLVDTGGGNRILKQLKDASVDLNQIHHVFISHKHIDHLLGILWIFRGVNMSMEKGIYQGDFHIYCHEEVASIIRMMVAATLRTSQQKYLDKRVFIHVIENHQIVNILKYQIEFFDIYSKNDKQYGFITKLNNGKKLVFCGDEPLDERNYSLVEDADYLLHEAFCLEEEAARFKPYEKNHDTAESASKKAEKLNIKNLILWHTHENLGKNRQTQYQEAATRYFSNQIFIPNDLDQIEL